MKRDLWRRWVLVLATGAALVLPVSAAQGTETPSPEQFVATVTPSSPTDGERITVVSDGWAPGTQLQAVVCGEQALSGSSSCFLAGAVTGLVDAEGSVTHVLAADAPPKPCPCVVRISTFTGDALAANVPIDLRGHDVAPLPEVEAATGDLRVEKVSLKGRSLIRTLLGVGGRATMTVTVANRGDVVAQAPDIEYGFGRGDVSLDQVQAVDLKIPAGATRRMEIDVDVSPLAFGSQQGVAQFEGGAGGVKSDSLSVYPVGVMLLLVGGLLAVVAWDLWRTGAARNLVARQSEGARRFLDEEEAYPLPEVVYIEDIGGYLIKPAVLKNSRIAAKIGGRVSVADLVKLVEGEGKALFPNGESAASPVGGGGALTTLLRTELHRLGSRGEGSSLGSGPGPRFFVRPERGGDAGRRADKRGGSGSGLSFFVRPDRDRDV